jgi:hypothetical protein
VETAMESWEVINPQVLIRFQPNWSKLEVKHYVLRNTYLFVLYGMRRNYHSSGRNLSLYQFVKRVIKLTNNYRGISLLSTAYKIVSNILLARLTQDVIEITGAHQCGLHHNRCIINQIFHICQILEKNWSTVGQCTSYL